MTQRIDPDLDRRLRDEIESTLKTHFGVSVRRIDIFETIDSFGDPIVRVEISFRRSSDPVSHRFFYDVVNLVGPIVETAGLPAPVVIRPYLADGQKVAEHA